MAARVSGEGSAHQPHRLRWVLVALVGVVGLGSAAIAWGQDARSARQSNATTAARARDVVADIDTELAASLAGTSGLVRPDGSVDIAAFGRFAVEVTQTSKLGSLAFEPVISEAERPAFEAAIGHPVMDRPSQGAARSPARPLHYPVQTIAPSTERSAQLIGFDLLGDPVRALAADLARDSGDVVVSQPVPSEPTGTESFFVIKAVYRPGPVATPDDRRTALVGFVSTAYTGASLADTLRQALPSATRFRVSDGDAVLAASATPAAAGNTVDVTVADRTWTLLIDGRASSTHAVAWLLGLLTLLLVGGLFYVFRRGDRHNREVERSAEVIAAAARTSEELAHLAQGLASQTSSDDVMTFLTTGVLAPLGAFHAAVAVVDGENLRRHFTPGPISEAARTLLPDLVPLASDSPLANAARTGTIGLLPDIDALHAQFPHLADGWVGLGFAATANLPLRDRRGRLIGALGIAWDHPIDLEAQRDVLATIAGIAGQTLERAQLVDRVHEQAARSDALASLAEVLATARSSREVVAAVVAHAAPVVGAARADIAIVGATGGGLEIHHGDDVDPAIRERRGAASLDDRAPHADAVRDGGTVVLGDRAEFAAAYPELLDDFAATGAHALGAVPLRSSSGSHLGAIAFHWDEPTPPSRLPLAELHSVADLCAQALERAQLSDAEHRLVVNLQSSLLTPLPKVEGLDCTARYVPAARSIGIGGDWYDMIERGEGRYAVVVGDVAGHGITAVGQMAQLRSTIGAIARLGTAVEDIFPVTASLRRVEELPIATAAFVEIDTVHDTLRYAAAGHPPPLLRQPDGHVIALEDGRQPLLGLPMHAVPAGSVAFPPGSTLLCYTDGLVERRDEPLDVSLTRLGEHLAELGGGGAEDLAERLLARCLIGETADDVAIALIRRLS